MSVAVMVTTPGRMPVARPSASIVAIVVSLLVQVIPGPPIGTGTTDPVVVPLANCPQSLPPQQRTPPSARTAQLCCHQPADRPTAVAMPDTATGEVWFCVPPFPSCPTVPSPQHCTVPPDNLAHVCAQPATISTAALIPATRTGVDEGVPVPSPS